MKDKTITGLTPLTTPSQDDVLAIVDVSDTTPEQPNGITKKITVSDLVSVAPSDLNSYITARHARLASRITELKSSNDGFLRGLSIGNSITAGSGIPNPGYVLTYSYRLGQHLADFFGYGAINNWAASNYGVGGGDIATCAGYVAHDGDGFAPVQGDDLPSRDYVTLMSLRNSTQFQTVRDYTDLLRVVLRNIMLTGIDVIFITEPPRIDVTTGDILDDNTSWLPWYETALRICAEEGVTVVDAWKYYKDQKENGLDLRDFTTDGVHYNAVVHQKIADLLGLAFQTPVMQQGKRTSSGGLRDYSRNVIIGKYEPLSGTPADISGLTTAATGRYLVKGEATKKAFTLQDTEQLNFRCPIPCKGVIVTMLGGSANDGVANIQYNALAIHGGSSLSSGGTIREVSHWLPLNSYDSNQATQYGVTNQNVKVIASGGQIQVTGVLMVGDKISSYNALPVNNTETGTWEDTTLPTTSESARRSSNIGDTFAYKFFGTSLNLFYKRGVDQGKFSWSVDGGTSTTVDCYLNGTFEQVFDKIKNLENKWHTLNITVEAKNSSSSNNYVTLGRFSTFDGEPKAPTMYAEMATGLTYPLLEFYERAIIHEVLDGTPEQPEFVAGDATVTLRGSGKAIVRLEG